MRRRFEPLVSISDQWERHSFESTVWQHNGHHARVIKVPTPEGYIPTLLVCYNGVERISVAEFGLLLSIMVENGTLPAGFTRADIEKEIAAP